MRHQLKCAGKVISRWMDRGGFRVALDHLTVSTTELTASEISLTVDFPKPVLSIAILCLRKHPASQSVGIIPAEGSCFSSVYSILWFEHDNVINTPK